MLGNIPVQLAGVILNVHFTRPRRARCKERWQSQPRRKTEVNRPQTGINLFLQAIPPKSVTLFFVAHAPVES